MTDGHHYPYFDGIFTLIQDFQMTNTKIIFDDLLPLSTYSICVLCGEVTREQCKQIMTIGQRKVVSNIDI